MLIRGGDAARRLSGLQSAGLGGEISHAISSAISPARWRFLGEMAISLGEIAEAAFAAASGLAACMAAAAAAAASAETAARGGEHGAAGGGEGHVGWGVGAPLYVGESDAIEQRLRQHRRSHAGRRLECVLVEVESKTRARELEALTIRRLKELGAHVKNVAGA